MYASSKQKDRNLTLRVLTAAALVPPVLWLIYMGGLWSAGLFALVSATCASEYYLIVFKRLTIVGWAAIGAALVMPLLPVLAPTMAWALAFCVVGLMFLFAWIFHLVRGPLAEAPTYAAHALTAVIFGGLGFTAVSALRVMPGRGLAWVIAVLVITWANDSMAYFAGRLLGRHKLYPEVSPNKTWEGFFGGMAGSVVGMFVLKLAFFPFLTVLDCAVVGLAGGILGPLGDLSESMLKRAYRVKDSGWIVPGHGGVLDRVDALLFNAPMVFAWVAFVRPLLMNP
ncbi:MAG TPA: phosphatidate cytidylyltransferase [Myxococcaceae bacterium]|nr:phosphatidate cytidylyltransferase [Myxococcaceae bacterium]